MRAAAGVAAIICALLVVLPVSADEGDSATIARPQARIGDQLRMIIEVVTPAGATVELDPAAASWAGIEVISLEAVESRQVGETTVHHLQILVAGFFPGDLEFQPAVSVVLGPDVTPRLLPAVRLSVTPTLPADAVLELSPLPEPAGIEGAQSPWLVPGVLAGAGLGAVLVALLLFFVGRALMRSLRSRPGPAVAAPLPGVDLQGAAMVIDADPVRAYRTLATVVRHLLSARYGFPAFALTTAELQRRMEAEGVDRWQSRLVGGLLQECDAVVYAGYRPASERRQADLNMAREIVEEAG